MKLNMKKLINPALLFLSKNGPAILTGIGIAAMGTAAVLTGEATIKAIDILKAEEEEKGKPLTKTETVQAVWKEYVAPVSTFALGAGCVIGGTKMNAKRYATLAAAYSLSEGMRTDYQSKVKELFGEDKERKVHDEVAQDRVTNAPPFDEAKIINTGKGTTLCLDPMTGRPFYSDMEVLKRAINVINQQKLRNGSVSLNDYWYEIGLDETPLGDKLIWIDNSNELIEPKFTSTLTKDGRPCLVLGFSIEPQYDPELY